jgi:hypothetical protein
VVRKALTTAALCVALAALSAGPAPAGEATGSGKKEDQNPFGPQPNRTK